MKQLVEFKLESGETVVFEVTHEYINETMPVASSKNLLVNAKQTLEDALDRVKPAASVLIQKIRSISDPPDEIQVDFGIKLNAITGAVIASTSIEANYNVKLIWRKKTKK